MVNEVILVGKIAKTPQLSKTANGNSITNIVIETVRHYKNSYGIYESDFLVVTLWRGMAQMICETCEVGSMLALKGRIQSQTYLEEDNRHFGCLEIVAEKVTILDQYFKQGSHCPDKAMAT